MHAAAVGDGGRRSGSRMAGRQEGEEGRGEVGGGRFSSSTLGRGREEKGGNERIMIAVMNLLGKTADDSFCYGDR